MGMGWPMGMLPFSGMAMQGHRAASTFCHRVGAGAGGGDGGRPKAHGKGALLYLGGEVLGICGYREVSGGESMAQKVS